MSKNFRTDHLKRELQMVHLSATRCSCFAILWVSLANSSVLTHCYFSSVYFCCCCLFRYGHSPEVLDTPAYFLRCVHTNYCRAFGFTFPAILVIHVLSFCCMGAKLGVSLWERDVDRGVLWRECWGRYLNLKGRKTDRGENCIVINFAACIQIYMTIMKS
jgi:hypothetical protein